MSKQTKKKNFITDLAVNYEVGKQLSRYNKNKRKTNKIYGTN